MSENPHSGAHAADLSDTWRRLVGPSVPVGLTLAAVGALSFLAGGYIVGSATPVVVGWLLLAAVWLLAFRPAGVPSAPLLLAVVILGLLALWTGLSILWSVGPDLSWVAFDYAALYVAAAALLAWGGRRRLQLLIASVGFLAGATAVAVYAYLGKVLPDLITHAQEYARLAAPVGYWNVLAVMLVMAAPIALSLAARRGLHPLLRGLASAVLALLLITLFFTFSRGGFAAAAVMIVVYFAAARERLSSLIAVLCAAAPVAFVLWHLRDLETLFGPTTDAARRTAEGHTLAAWTILALGLPFVLQVGVAYGHRRLSIRPSVVRWVGVAVLVAVLAVCIGGPLLYMQRQGGVGDWVRTQYTNFVEGPESEGGNDAGRVLVVSSNGRVGLYRVALRQYRYTPLVGTGAGTFAFSNYRFRDTGLFVKHAHSQWFNTMSELGLVGLGLLAAFVVALAVAVIATLIRLRRDRERGLLAACLAASVGFVFHISGDWDWDMAAVTLAFLLLAVTAARYGGSRETPVAVVEAAAALVDESAGVPDERQPTGSAEVSGGPTAATTATLEAGGPAGGRRAAAAASDAAGPAAVIPAVLEPVSAPVSALDDGSTATAGRRLSWPLVGLWAGLLVVLVVSWLLPFLSLRADDRALAAAGDGRLVVAEAEARTAHRLDPLAVGPLLTLAGIEVRLGRPEEALAVLEQAAALQPENYNIQYQLGVLLADSLGRPAEAAAAYRRALELNPRHALSRSRLESLSQR